MTNKALAILGVVLGLPAAIFTTIEIIDRLDTEPKSVSDTIRISAVTKIKWPGFEPPRLKDKNLVARVALECDGKLNCKYDHVFSNAYIGRIAVDWMCVPTGESRTKEFLREVPRMKNGEEPLSLILSCF